MVALERPASRLFTSGDSAREIPCVARTGCFPHASESVRGHKHIHLVNLKSSVRESVTGFECSFPVF
jgi:hypothetical protein